MSLRKSFFFLLILSAILGLSLPGSAGEATFGKYRVTWPDGGKRGAYSIESGGKKIIDNFWFYLMSPHDDKTIVRSSGQVLESRTESPGGGAVRVIQRRDTDVKKFPDTGVFEMDFRLFPFGDGVVMDFTTSLIPKRKLRIEKYYLYIKTPGVSKDAARVAMLGREWELISASGKDIWDLDILSPSLKAGKRKVSAPEPHSFLGLENEDGVFIYLGAPYDDVTAVEYDFRQQRLSVRRDHAWGFPVAARNWIGVGLTPEQARDCQKMFEREAVGQGQWREPAPWKPSLAKALAAGETFQGVEETDRAWRIGAGAMRLSVGKKNGELIALDLAGGKAPLSAPGGFRIFSGTKKEAASLGAPQAATTSANGKVAFSQSNAAIEAKHLITAHSGYALWETTVRNRSQDTQLLEARLALPLTASDGDSRFWDGFRVWRPKAGVAYERTSLYPQFLLTSGFFPIVGYCDRANGLAVGMPPEQIESYFGGRLDKESQGARELSYGARLALRPGQERTVRFILYPFDPDWTWRSLVERYWDFFPKTFTATEREDIWGSHLIYSARGPFVEEDRFIDLCRRMRIGAFEMARPYWVTGDFYPETEPAYGHPPRLPIMNREQVKQAYETANIASCLMSYVIPMKCEKELAEQKYTDAMFRFKNGENFYARGWGDEDNGAYAMFAWGNSFADEVYGDLLKIVDNYQPEGFYFDNGSYAWADYGKRETPWDAFDDEGAVYRNVGIAYVKILDYLREKRPGVLLHPGENMQYFCGFRADSYLTNMVIDSSPVSYYYIRSHRLIMGRKPIFADSPWYMNSRERLHQTLELGALTWLTNLNPERKGLVDEWMDLVVDLARAGWRPITRAYATDERIRVERFGEGERQFFTVRNLSLEPVATDIHIADAWPEMHEYRNRVALAPKVDEKSDITKLRMSVPARQLVVLRTASDEDPSPAYPAAPFLAEAEPVSIVLTSQDKTCQWTARRIRGFVLMQAKALNKTPEVEIVSDAGAARHAKVIIRQAPKASIRGEGANQIVIEGPDEPTLRRITNDFLLNSISAPLNDREPLWTLAVPGVIE